MSTYQRRRGIPAKVWRTEKVLDARGNETKVASPDNKHEIKVWIFPQRSAKAEVNGQQHINVVRIGTTANLEGVDLWSRVEMQGREWDVVSPPAYHHGSRQTRHWSIDVRERP